MAPFVRGREVLDLHFDSNVKGLFFLFKSSSVNERRRAIIVNASIATNQGLFRHERLQRYQAAVRSFARTWTNELRERRIRVNAISPGHIDTPIMESLQQATRLSR